MTHQPRECQSMPIDLADFKVTHLPDKVRTDWLIRNSE